MYDTEDAEQEELERAKKDETQEDQDGRERPWIEYRPSLLKPL